MDYAAWSTGKAPVETAGDQVRGSVNQGCPVGTAQKYDDGALAVRFASDKIYATSDGLPRWNATVPEELALTSKHPSKLPLRVVITLCGTFLTDRSCFAVDRPMERAEDYDPVVVEDWWLGAYSAPSRTVPAGQLPGLHFEDGPDAPFNQVMYANKKMAFGVSSQAICRCL